MVFRDGVRYLSVEQCREAAAQIATRGDRDVFLRNAARTPVGWQFLRSPEWRETRLGDPAAWPYEPER